MRALSVRVPDNGVTVKPELKHSEPVLCRVKDVLRGRQAEAGERLIGLLPKLIVFSEVVVRLGEELSPPDVVLRLRGGLLDGLKKAVRRDLPGKYVKRRRKGLSAVKRRSLGGISLRRQGAAVLYGV